MSLFLILAIEDNHREELVELVFQYDQRGSFSFLDPRKKSFMLRVAYYSCKWPGCTAMMPSYFLSKLLKFKLMPLFIISFKSNIPDSKKSHSQSSVL